MTPEMLEKLDLSQGALGEDLLAEDICDFLDCYTFAGLVVRRSTWDESDQHAGLVENGGDLVRRLTKQCHRRLVPAPWLRCSAHQRRNPG